MGRSLKVTITSVRRCTVRPLGGVLRARCAVCEREVELVSRAQAIVILGGDGHSLDRFVAGGLVHSLRTVSGSVLLCKDSLFLR